MKLLGFDPGPSNIGWSMITTDPLEWHKHGSHHIEYKFAETVRMGLAYRFIGEQIAYFKPDVVVVEDAFSFGKVFTVKDIIKIIALVQLACDDRGVRCELVSPSQWQSKIIEGPISKDRVVRKQQVGEGVRRLLPSAPVSKAGKAEHENDALAIAVAYTLPSPVKKKRKAKTLDEPVKAYLAKEAVRDGC